MMAWFAGCLARPVRAPGGILRWSAIRDAIRPDGPHCAGTGCVSLENTHNMAGGAVTPLDVIEEICREAHQRGLRVHMDGARVFNAACALGVEVRQVVKDVDTVMFCLSKGLGAPVGSMLAGTAEAIHQGRLYRKRLGGGMRQAGVLAAAGLIALEQMPARLGEDHANARLIAHALEAIPGVAIDASTVQTNIVIFDISGTGMTPPEFSRRLKERGVRMNGVGATRMRAVTHCDVTRQHCEHAVEAIREVCAAVAPARA